jgi:hypothetical protein
LGLEKKPKRKYNIITERKVKTMLHMYEIRKLEENGKVTIIRQLTAEPKLAKKTFREYAEENPGIYSLYQVHRVGVYFTEKE